MDDKSYFFHQLSKLVAVKYSNYLISTQYRNTLEEAHLARDKVLYPLLQVCEDVHLVGYDECWLDELLFDPEEYPWLKQLHDSIVESDFQGYKFVRTQLLNKSLESFWLNPTVYGKNKKTLMRDFSFPGVIIIELNVAELPIQILSEQSASFASVSNPYSGRLKKAKSWLKGNFSEIGKVFVSYENPTSFRFLGAPQSLEFLVDRFMNEVDLKASYGEYCPSYWLERYEVVGGDPEKAFQDIFGRKK